MESPADGTITRRALLGAAAGATALIGMRGLPAWARPVGTGAGLRGPDSLPFPGLPAGTPTMPQIKHIVVVIMENHSFDNVLGMVPHLVPGRESVDGFQLRRGRPANSNPDARGARVFARHAVSPCQISGAPSQLWNASHRAYDGGRNDGFVRASGRVAMRFWDQRDLPFTYSLAAHFPIGQRFFSSVLGQTFPNRSFFFAGTSSGTINDTIAPGPPANGTIFDRLDANHVEWAIYYENYASFVIVPGANTTARLPRVRRFDRFRADVAAGRLPQFTFLDPNYTTTSEENPQDIQVGERFLAGVVAALVAAPTWKHTALFIAYDEHGGYYDHVPPPRATPPDSILPMLGPDDVAGAFDRYGFRVPLIVVSPWARAGYVSGVTQDLTSITAFIERKWNLPAMTFRDANAHPMTDYFDFRRPVFARPPALAPAPALGPGLAKCDAAGLQPPLAG